MKKTIIFVILVSSFIFLTACASDDEIADELIDYHNNEWIPIHVMKERDASLARKELMNVLSEFGEDYEEEAIALHESDIIPLADKVIDRYESIQIKSRKVKKLNKMQIKAEKNGKELLESIIDYYNGDLSDSEHRQKENEAKRKYEEVIDYLEELMDTYNLEYDKEKGKVDGYYELKRKEE